MCNGECCSCWFCPLGEILAAIERNSLAISVKVGLSDGSDDQHLSINNVHSGSQDSGTGGRKVLLTIPPEFFLATTCATGQFNSNLRN